MGASRRLIELGLVLPPPPAPVARFLPAVEANGLLFLSGLAPLGPDGAPVIGLVGQDFTAEEAQGFARLVGLNLLSVMQATLGSLDRVQRIVKVLGLVNAVPDFTRHPFVIDGCSTLFYEVFGDQGMHARTAMGAGSLPSGIPVEIEAVVQIA
ncbi:RidA family protein [Rhizobium sp. CC-YZS058]|uniref:RidA family protein n=1 Tax=Rhizobium sp. CC-YZS058 TaxID=3042153 RepID=UPI002B05458F|nr:RidA family protein [Rhizobium sp. CC-YZS058]MEA3535900.1 RidA family protein [Rhizobium sp. CC-YZS058]